ncbi:MAG: 2-succinyl-6-hydroxy-2,4-cyclohexadiene-1-carboxylate synthase [Cyanobacteria bacterium P01_A01_bin.84]
MSIKNNYKLNYQLVGKPENPVVLFLHGFMGNINEFEGVISVLSSSFYCLLVDLPGHGETQVLSDDDYTMSNIANALIKLLDSLKDSFQDTFKNSKFILIGYSMGGRLSLYLTLNFPQYFSRVILESASPGLKTEIERQERIKRDAQIARKLNRISSQSEFKIFLDNWYRQPVFGDIKNNLQFSKLIQIRLQNNPHRLAKSLEIMGTGSQNSLWDKLENNQVPILLLVGEYDTKFVEINQQMNNLLARCLETHLQRSHLKVIKNTGHNIHFENPSGFISAIFNFIN